MPPATGSTGHHPLPALPGHPFCRITTGNRAGSGTAAFPDILAPGGPCLQSHHAPFTRAHPAPPRKAMAP